MMLYLVLKICVFDIYKIKFETINNRSKEKTSGILLYHNIRKYDLVELN